jgi:hypothetical protein
MSTDHATSQVRTTEPVTPAPDSPKPDAYRGWEITWDYGFFTATGPDYDASWEGEEDGWVDNGQRVTARTLEGLYTEIDDWFEEQQDRPHTAAEPLSAGNSELEPDGQGNPSCSDDRQGGPGREVGGRAALFASSNQRGQRDVRGGDQQDDQVSDGGRGVSTSSATLKSGGAS